jgi:hypothetical protein
VGIFQQANFLAECVQDRLKIRAIKPGVRKRHTQLLARRQLGDIQTAQDLNQVKIITSEALATSHPSRDQSLATLGN